MLTHRLPYPPDRGDRIRSYHLLKALAEHFTVDIACTSEDVVWLQHHQLLATIADRVLIQPVSANLSRMRGGWAFLTGQPVTPACHYRPGMAATLRQWHERKPFDVVLTFCTGMIDYARLITQPQNRTGPPGPNDKPVRHVLDLVDVDSIKWAGYARHTWAPLRWVYAAEARRLRRVEAGQFDHLDAVTVVSDAEALAYRQHVGDHPNLQTVHNGVDLDYFSPLADGDPHTLVFVGVLNYRPNAEGITWFVKRALPTLRKRVANAKLMIVGRHPTQHILELGRHPGVEVVGSVPDVRQYLQQASIVIAPLQLARGVQNKVLEAMACAKPVVCSPQAAQGINADTQRHLRVADTPDQWANQIKTLMDEPTLRQSIGRAAREHVEQHHSWQKCLQPMIDLIAGRTPVA